MTKQAFVLLSLPLLASLAGAAPQGELFTFPGATAVNAGDLDSDGKTDFLVGEPDESTASAGRVVVYSGLSGAQLVVYQPTPPVTRVGDRVAALGDVDGDGKLDFAALEVETTTPYIAVVSGASGARLYRCSGPTPQHSFGDFIALDDVDGDGRRDLADGELALFGSSPFAPGIVRIRSGATGTILRTINAPGGQALFGGALDLHEDLDLDGVRDLLVGAHSQIGVGAAYIVSPASGATLFTNLGSTTTFASSVASLGDVDGDGTSDIAVGDPSFASTTTFDSSIRIVAVPSGATIQTIHASYGQIWLGLDVSRIGDYDGDGLADVLCCAGYSKHGCCAVFDLPSEIHSGLTGAALYSGWYDKRTSVEGLTDLDGDGKPDYLAGSHDNGSGSPKCAVVLSGRWAGLVMYPCDNSANANSLGCIPQLEFSGAPSLTTGDPFRLHARLVRNNRPGVLVWSLNAISGTLGSQLLCIGGPRHTFGAQLTGGSATGNDCTGQMNFPLPRPTMLALGWTAGSYVYAQAFSRDPNAASSTQVSLSSGLVISVWP